MTEPFGSPTARRRQLASELRRLRQQVDMTIADVTRALRWNVGKLSKIENRRIGISAGDTSRLLDLFGVTDEAERGRLIELALYSNERAWWQRSPMSAELRTLIGLEIEASQIRTYQPEVIYGLLQTPAYAEAVISEAHTDVAEIARLVEVRLARQEILNRDHPDPPYVHVVLSEGAIRRLVGGPDVMREQLGSLARNDRPNVITQVVPFDAGAHAAMAGSILLIDFPSTKEHGVAFAENVSGALTLEAPDDLQRYRAAFDAVAGKALSPAESRDMIIKLANSL